jgi:DNA-directed RNA polymerase specialized sigma24 family protein
VRKISTFAAADDPALFAAVAALSTEAVEETYERHVTALCSLALLITGEPRLATHAVAEAFIALWRAPSSICLEEQSLRAALAGEVYTRCIHVRETREHAPGQRAKPDWSSQSPARADLALLPGSQRDLLALILLGGHNRRQAASRLGLDEATAARMIMDAMHTMSHVGGQPRLSVTAAIGFADVPESVTPRWSMTHRGGSIS